MQNTLFDSPFGTFELKRRPARHHPSLQAWDAADRRILAELTGAADSVSQLIVNDAFGALSIPLAKFQVINWGDSAVSALAIAENLHRNQLPQIPFATSMDAVPVCDRVLLKIPDNARLFAWQLAQLNQALPQGTPIILAGMQKYVAKAHEAAMDVYLDQITPQLTKQRARLWLARTGQNQVVPIADAYDMNGISIRQHPGVFAEQKLDIGTRVMLEYLDKIEPGEQVCDLCCGAGNLAAAWLQKHPSAKLTLTDASAIAMDCTLATMQHNYPNAELVLHHTDGFENIEQSFDLILCNPPFHQHGAITTDLAWYLFKQAAKQLNPGGRFAIVANRHLGYHQILKRLFKRVDTISKDPKFVVMVCR